MLRMRTLPARSAIQSWLRPTRDAMAIGRVEPGGGRAGGGVDRGSVVPTGRTMGSSVTVTPWRLVGPGPGSSTVVEVVLVEVDDVVVADEDDADDEHAAAASAQGDDGRRGSHRGAGSAPVRGEVARHGGSEATDRPLSAVVG